MDKVLLSLAHINLFFYAPVSAVFLEQILFDHKCNILSRSIYFIHSVTTLMCVCVMVRQTPSPSLVDQNNL